MFLAAPIRRQVARMEFPSQSERRIAAFFSVDSSFMIFKMLERSGKDNSEMIVLRKTIIGRTRIGYILDDMEVEFDDDDLKKLYTDPRFTSRHSQAVVSRFRDRIGFIKAAKDERDIYAMRSFRFERLKGNRQDEFSIRLNDQWRLIVQIRGAAPLKRIGVLAIEDYH